MELQFAFGNPTKKRGIAKKRKARKNKHKAREKVSMRKHKKRGAKKNPYTKIAYKKGAKTGLKLAPAGWRPGKDKTYRKSLKLAKLHHSAKKRDAAQMSSLHSQLAKEKNKKRKAQIQHKINQLADNVTFHGKRFGTHNSAIKKFSGATMKLRRKIERLQKKGYKFRKIELSDKAAEQLKRDSRVSLGKKGRKRKTKKAKKTSRKAKKTTRKSRKSTRKAKKTTRKTRKARKTSRKRKSARKATRRRRGRKASFKFSLKVPASIRRKQKVTKKFKRGGKRFRAVITRTNPIFGGNMIGKVNQYAEMVLLNSGEELIGSGLGAVATAVLTKNKMVADVTNNALAKAEEIHPVLGAVARVVLPSVAPLAIAHAMKMTKNRHAIAAAKAIANVQVFAMAQQMIVEGGKPFGLAAIPDMRGVDFTPMSGVDYTPMAAIPDMRGADFGKSEADFGRAGEVRSPAGVLKSPADFGGVDFTPMSGAHDMDSDNITDMDEEAGETGDRTG